MINLIPTILPVVGKVLDRIIPDKAAAAKAQREIEIELLRSASEINAKQLEINKQEAAHTSIFVSGWRPFVGWVCGSGFALKFFIFPILDYVRGCMQLAPINLQFDIETMMTMLLGLLGLGGYRTLEKIKGVARK